MNTPTLPQSSPLFKHFPIDPTLVYLNHGSFGGCPLEVLDAQSKHQLDAERDLVDFYVNTCWPKLDNARSALSKVINANPQDLVFLHNATSAVATVLHNLNLTHNDELLVTNLEYPACLHNFSNIASNTNATLITADIPYPLESDDQIIDAILSKVTPNTKLMMFSLVTSFTAIHFPAKKLINALKDQGVETLLDAAHGPACVPMDLNDWNPAYTTGNNHKWLCAPKGSAFLHVRKDLQHNFTPLVLSNDAMDLQSAASQTNRSPFNHAFDYAGTDDLSAHITIPDAIDWLTTHAGSIDNLMTSNRELCLEARSLLANTLNTPLPVPDSMIGPLATITLPTSVTDPKALKSALYNDYRIQVPITQTPIGPSIRISAQLHNTIDQYHYLASALKALIS